MHAEPSIDLQALASWLVRNYGPSAMEVVARCRSDNAAVGNREAVIRWNTVADEIRLLRGI